MYIAAEMLAWAGLRVSPMGLPCRPAWPPGLGVGRSTGCAQQGLLDGRLAFAPFDALAQMAPWSPVDFIFVDTPEALGNGDDL